jgi:glucose-6-phosphate isomerase
LYGPIFGVFYMQRRPIEPLILQPAAAEGDGERFSANLAAARPALAAARNELLATWQTVPGPGLLAARRLLDEYRAGGGRIARQSQLGQVLARARLVADQVDRVVVIAGRDVCLAAKAVLASCAHPHHNELSRAERGGYPRIHLESGPVDNDALAGLLDLLAPSRVSTGLDSRWALISLDDGTIETAAKTQVLAQALENVLAGDRERLEQLLVKLPGPGGSSLSDPFTPGVLMPSALAGLDVVGLLSGAAAMIERFISDPPQNCPALQLAGLCHLAGPITEACQMTVWSQSLESVAHWHGRLREQTLGDRPASSRETSSQENGSKSASDLHHHRPAEKIGPRQLVLNVVAERLRRDRLEIEGRPLSEMMDRARAAALAAQQVAGQPVVELRLPHIDECSIGQLLQLLLLTAAVEARLALNQNPKLTHA